jgi:hypothetical protein
VVTISDSTRLGNVTHDDKQHARRHELLARVPLESRAVQRRARLWTPPARQTVAHHPEVEDPGWESHSSRGEVALQRRRLLRCELEAERSSAVAREVPHGGAHEVAPTVA